MAEKKKNTKKLPVAACELPQFVRTAQKSTPM